MQRINGDRDSSNQLDSVTDADDKTEMKLLLEADSTALIGFVEKPTF